MLTTILENIDGTIYNVINDKAVCDELHKQIGFLKVKNIKYNFHSKEAHLITVAYRSEHGALLLTKIENINMCIMHLLKADKFIITNHRFEPKLYRGIILYGDVYYTDEAVKTIATNDRPWCFYLRESASEITGKPWGEIFAFSFDGSLNKFMLENLKNISFKAVRRNIPKPAGWTLLRYLLNVKKTKDIFVPEHSYAYINIDDWTDDFDYPHDLDTWQRLRLT
jgi:hypothetical protein